MFKRTFTRTACLLLVLMGFTMAFGSEAEQVEMALRNYAAAVESKDMAEIEKYVVTGEQFSMFEGSHVNLGWADYRDHHLGPELKDFLELQYDFENIKPRVSGNFAYATLKYRIHVRMTEREATGEGLATVILVKQGDGWKIQHMHTSRIPKQKHQQR